VELHGLRVLTATDKQDDARNASGQLAPRSAPPRPAPARNRPAPWWMSTTTQQRWDNILFALKNEANIRAVIR
jgi:hypothetical protein